MSTKKTKQDKVNKFIAIGEDWEWEDRETFATLKEAREWLQEDADLCDEQTGYIMQVTRVYQVSEPSLERTCKEVTDY